MKQFITIYTTLCCIISPTLAMDTSEGDTNPNTTLSVIPLPPNTVLDESTDLASMLSAPPGNTVSSVTSPKIVEPWVDPFKFKHPIEKARADTKRFEEMKYIKKLNQRLNTLSRGNNYQQENFHPAAVFLGPRGENHKMLEELIRDALADHVHWRRHNFPHDPVHITEDMKSRPAFTKTQSILKQYVNFLMAELNQSCPFFSPRYQGHMNWENTMPGIIGYITAMLYNPNNVTFEASPVTTVLEDHVAKDLCQLIGYATKKELLSEPDPQKSTPLSWGHLTCDGTVANIEALWAARELKFYPIAVKWALENDKDLAIAQEIEIAFLPETQDSSKKRKKLRELTYWELLNLASDHILALPERIAKKVKKTKDSSYEHSKILEGVYKKIANFSLQKLGFLKMYRKLDSAGEKIGEPVIIIPGTAHYSFVKGVSLLGIGQENIIYIPVDENARMELSALRTALFKCYEKRQPVVTVGAIMGTTEESAVDPLRDIIDLRKQFRSGIEKDGISEGTPLDFIIHADAAWGGYFLSLLREKNSSLAQEENTDTKQIPIASLSPYVQKNFEAICLADSATIDPHKSGYLPYAVGALCYRNSAMKNLLNFTAPYIDARSEKEPCVGTFGIEGSKAGAQAAAVFLNHKVIPLTKEGYGAILSKTLYNTKTFHKELLNMKSKDFFVIPLPQEPLLDSQQNMGTSGPDLNILVYAFNFKIDGQNNEDLDLANKFNFEISQKLRPNYKSNKKLKLYVSSTTFRSDIYGPKLLINLMTRLSLKDPRPSADSLEPFSLNVLRSVIMNPWVTEVEDGLFQEITPLNIFMNSLQKTVQKTYDNRKQWMH